MALIQWTQEMSVGLESIDTDHKLLLKLINQMDEGIRNKRGNDMVNAVIEALLEYTDYHFRREEVLMAACGYPDIEAHTQIHSVLRDQVAQIRDRHAGNPASIRDREVLSFLRNWLTSHIMGRDKLYAPFLAAKPEAVEKADRAFSGSYAKASPSLASASSTAASE
jgi:hemerythrin